MEQNTRILIVEDHPSDAILVKHELDLALTHCITHVVETEPDFIRALKEFKPDLIISDYLMPGFDGLTALKIATSQTPLTPVIIATGSMNEETAVICMKAGATDYVIKEHLRRLGPAVIHALEQKKIKAEKIKAEIALKEKEEALRKSEERYRTIARLSSDFSYSCIHEADGSYCVDWITDAFFSLTGYTDTELQQNKCWMFVAHPDDRKMATEPLDRLKIGETDTREFRILNRNGDVLHILNCMECKADNTVPDGLRIFGSVQNITDRITAIRELVAAREKAEESDRLKSTFLANMSHEIRTPMNAIVGFAGMISDPELSDDDRKKFSGIVQSRSDDLMHIIDDILEISRIESGNATLVEGEVNLNSMLQQIETETVKKIKRVNKAQLSLLCEIPESKNNTAFISDPYIIKQVFTNLIDNAIKYTHTGSIRFGYHTPVNGTLTCFVTDTGIGISPENHAVIFEHFRQAKVPDPHQYGGTGLGLSICKGSLALLGGEIRVESEQGKGSTFYFTLPFDLPVSIAPPPFGGGRKEAVSEIYNWSGKKLLLVEDDQSNMEFLQIILGQTFAELVMVFSGRELKAMYDQLDSFDAVLLDIRLPDASGWDLARELKAISPDLPVIAQTAYAMSTDLQKSIEAGCDGYISKPIRKELLLDIISRHL